MIDNNKIKSKRKRISFLKLLISNIYRTIADIFPYASMFIGVIIFLYSLEDENYILIIIYTICSFIIYKAIETYEEYKILK